jgi:hypothetical protein
MLTIRKEQFEAFKNAKVDDFLKRVVKGIRASYPDETSGISAGDLLKMAREGMERAKRYTIIYEDDLERFITLMVVRGSDFDTDGSNPRIPEILAASDMTADEKLTAIEALPSQDGTL